MGVPRVSGVKRRSAGYADPMDEVELPSIPPGDLPEDELFQQLISLHRTRDDTLRHGSDQALAHHDARLAELEAEYKRRFPGREIDPARLRPPHHDDALP